MARLFAVTYSPGPAWNHAGSLEAQNEWESHAALMDALVAEEFVLLGGPLDGTSNVLMIIRANDAEEVRLRLADDPWIRDGVREIAQLLPWTLRLGSLT